MAGDLANWVATLFQPQQAAQEMMPTEAASPWLSPRTRDAANSASLMMATPAIRQALYGSGQPPPMSLSPMAPPQDVVSMPMPSERSAQLQGGRGGQGPSMEEILELLRRQGRR